MTGVLCKDCEYNKETNLFHTGRYCMRLGAICGLLGCEEGVPKVKTNADKIRAMSDEKLADMFAEASVKTIEALMDAFKITDYEYNKDGFARSWMDWLRSEADE